MLAGQAIGVAGTAASLEVVQGIVANPVCQLDHIW
jgi:hypothetical protein